jgi:hypothetical protein
MSRSSSPQGVALGWENGAPSGRSAQLQLPVALALTLGFICAALFGCGPKGLPTKVISGSVTCGGQPVPTGQVSFMPIEGTPGPNSAARIVDGRYRIEARGGVALGKHRVCVDARKKTGRKVEGYNGREATMVDEEVRLGPAIYAGDQSPLTVEIKVDSDGRYDIVIPGQ